MMRKPLSSAAVAIALLVLVASLVGCSGSDVACEGAAGKLSSPYVVEGDTWSGYAAFRDTNLLPGKLTYKEELDQAKRACDLSKGDVAFEVTTIGQYLKNKPDGVIVGVIDQSQGADALVLDSKRFSYLKSIDGLPRLVSTLAKSSKSKPTLAFAAGTPSEELLNELANSFDDLKLEQFNLVPVLDSPAALKMLEDSSAEAAILWEPDVATAKDEGYSVAYSSKDVPNSIVDVLVASNRVVRDDPAAVQQVVDAYYRYMDDKLANKDQLTKLIAYDAKLSNDKAAPLLNGIKFYGSKEAEAFLNRNVFPLDEPQVRQSMKAIGALAALSDPSLAVSDQMVNGTFLAKTTR